MPKPAFDPSQPFESTDLPSAGARSAKPGFDPSKPFSTGGPRDPGGSPDSPISDNLLGDTERAAGSFGNDPGIAHMLVSKGFTGAKRNAAGDLVFQRADGKWFKDADNFFSQEKGAAGYLPDHPINWAESHLGKALPTVGMMAGGAAGSPGGIPGAMGGGAAGAIGGEALRQAAGTSMGTYDGDATEHAKDLASEGMVGGLTEGAARVAEPVIGPYIKTGMETLGSGVKSGVARASSLMTGVPHEAIERLIERPTQVLGASAPRTALNTAEQANQELMERNQTEKEAIQGARRAFRDQFGDQTVDTRPIIENHGEFLHANAPTDSGVGPLSQEERDALGSMGRKGLTTEARATELKDVKPQLGPVKVQQVEPESADPSFIGSRSSDPIQVPTQEVKGLSLQFGKNGDMLVDSYPQKNAADLQRFADHLGNEIKRFDQSKLPGSGDTRFQSYMRGLYGQVKDALHTMDPEGLAVADKRFSEYADLVKHFGRLEDDGKMEGFINQFYGPNKTAMQEAAQELIPSSMDAVKDLGASRAFTKQGPAGSEMGMRRMGGLLLGAETYHSTHNPLLAGAAAVSTSPEVHKQAIGRAAQGLEAIRSAPWFQMIQKNPVLLESIGNPELKQAVAKLLNEDAQTWLPQAADNNPPKRGLSGQ